MADLRYFVRSEFMRTFKKNFDLICKQFSSLNTYFLKDGRICSLSLDELGEKSQTTIILDNFVNKALSYSQMSFTGQKPKHI